MQLVHWVKKLIPKVFLSNNFNILQIHVCIVYCSSLLFLLFKAICVLSLSPEGKVFLLMKLIGCRNIQLINLNRKQP